MTASSFASGPSFEITQTQDFQFPLSPGVEVLPFDQFDDMGGSLELLKVSLTVEAQMGAEITAENDSTIPAPDFGVLIAGFLNADFASIDANLTFDEIFSSGGVGRSDGVPGSGDDFFDFGSVGDSDSDMDMTTEDLGQYIGGGTINANIFASGGFTVVGSTDSTLTIDNFMASGTVTLVYEYIPAPGAFAMLVLAGVAGQTRRRRA